MLNKYSRGWIHVYFVINVLLWPILLLVCLLYLLDFIWFDILWNACIVLINNASNHNVLFRNSHRYRIIHMSKKLQQINACYIIHIFSLLYASWTLFEPFVNYGEHYWFLKAVNNIAWPARVQWRLVFLRVPGRLVWIPQNDTNIYLVTKVFSRTSEQLYHILKWPLVLIIDGVLSRVRAILKVTLYCLLHSLFIRFIVL